MKSLVPIAGSSIVMLPVVLRSVSRTCFEQPAFCWNTISLPRLRLNCVMQAENPWTVTVAVLSALTATGAAWFE